MFAIVDDSADTVKSAYTMLQHMQQMMKPLTDIAHVIGNVITRLITTITAPIARLLGITPRQVWVRIGQIAFGVLCLWQVGQIISSWWYGPNEASPWSLAILNFVAYALLGYLAYRIFKNQKAGAPAAPAKAAPPVNRVVPPPAPAAAPPRETPRPAPTPVEDLNIIIQRQVQIAVENVVPVATGKILEAQLLPLIQELRAELQSVKSQTATFSAAPAAPSIARKSALFRFECETADVILVRMETSLYWEIELGSEFARGEKEIEELVVHSLQSALTWSISERTLSDIKVSIRQVQDVVRADALAYLEKYVKVHRLDFVIKQMSLPKDIVERATQHRATQAYSNTDQIKTENEKLKIEN